MADLKLIPRSRRVISVGFMEPERVEGNITAEPAETRGDTIYVQLSRTEGGNAFARAVSNTSFYYQNPPKIAYGTEADNKANTPLGDNLYYDPAMFIASLAKRNDAEVIPRSSEGLFGSAFSGELEKLMSEVRFLGTVGRH